MRLFYRPEAKEHGIDSEGGKNCLMISVGLKISMEGEERRNLNSGKGRRHKKEELRVKAL